MAGGKVSKLSDFVKRSMGDYRKGPGLHTAAEKAIAEGDTKAALAYLKQLQELLQLSNEEFGHMMSRQLGEPPVKKQEGGSVDSDKRSLLRAIMQSLANQVPFVEESTREEIGETLSHISSGLMSQTHGINPETGELEFGLFNPAYFIPSEERQANPELQEVFERETTRTRAIPGIIDETMALPLLGEVVGFEAPEFVKAAGERTAATRQKVREGIGLDAPEGFLQHLADAGGMMMGQLPVPISSLSKVTEFLRNKLPAGKSIIGALKPVRMGAEFLSPIIEPKIGNYIAGALFGGGLGIILDPSEVPPDIEALVEAAEAGDEEALAQLKQLYAEYLKQQKMQKAMDLLNKKAYM